MLAEPRAVYCRAHARSLDERDSELRSNALAGYARDPKAVPFGEEIAFYEEEGGTVVGLLIRDRAGNDFSGSGVVPEVIRLWLNPSNTMEFTDKAREKVPILDFVFKYIDPFQLTRSVIGDFLECSDVLQSAVPSTSCFGVDPVAGLRTAILLPGERPEIRINFSGNPQGSGPSAEVRPVTPTFG